MWRISVSVITLWLSSHYSHQYKIADLITNEPNNHFDILMFSRQWPVTICKHWTHHLNGSECIYPNKKNQWTVHGICPTSLDRTYPQYCNKSWAFDPEQIQCIESELDQEWTNIYKGADSYIFWGHEWQTHGTCATEQEQFNSQIKYFSKGIEWHQKYSLLDMFNAANIFPSDNKLFSPEEFANAVKAKIKKNPMVSCSTIDGVLYLKEIRLCFDKQLNLIDCDPVADESCDVLNGIIFPANAC